MSFWLYQMSAKEWSPKRYRAEVWEGNDTTWETHKITPPGNSPEYGDIVVLFYAKAGATDPGIYGWAVVLWCDGEEMRFRPALPSDYLKMNPLWNDEVSKIVDQIRRGMPRGTMWIITTDLMNRLKEMMMW